MYSIRISRRCRTSKSQVAVLVSHHRQNPFNWLLILVLSVIVNSLQHSVLMKPELSKTAAQNICSRVTHMQSRTEPLKACGNEETAVVRSVVSSWHFWSQRLTLLYHVVCVRSMLLRMLSHRNTCICTSLSECFTIRVHAAVYYVRTYVSNAISFHTYIHACIYTYIHTHTHTYIHTHTYVRTYKQAHRHTHNNGLFQKVYLFPS